MTQISILGCGWLGFPLAEKLLQNGYSVKGATTSEDKLPLLYHAGIQPFLVSVSSSEVNGDMALFLENSDILLINIPPKLKGNANASFVDKIKIMLPYIEASSVKKIIFISSTSVYSDNNAIITENTSSAPDTESGRQLLEAENLLRENDAIQTTIIRFGGLIGNDRHPIRFLAGRKNIENPEAPINLIHLDDCIGIIEKVIEKNIWNETFNAVAPFHPSRENYYHQKAAALKLALPEFDHGTPSVGKTILSDRLVNVLGYSFIKNNL